MHSPELKFVHGSVTETSVNRSWETVFINGEHKHHKQVTEKMFSKWQKKKERRRAL